MLLLVFLERQDIITWKRSNKAKQLPISAHDKWCRQHILLFYVQLLIWEVSSVADKNAVINATLGNNLSEEEGGLREI